MNYIGIDTHKKYSVLCARNEAGEIVLEGKDGSGGKTHHGKLLPQCNGWPRWALAEAAWVGIGCEGYFGALYLRAKKSGHGSNTGIIIVARRMA